ncbi:hypothetical protein AMTRI_Chr09g35320 [Amborella trichopoda]
MPKSIICYMDFVFTSAFCKELFRLQGTSFNFSLAYHPQTNGQMEVVNRTVDMYLRCFTSNNPKEWVRWIAWAEYSYNTSIHSSTGKTPYEIVYSRLPPTLLSHVPGATSVELVEKELVDRDQLLNELQIQLQAAQNRKKYFEIRDLVDLSLQPYRQVSISLRKNLKLSPRYYGPYEIIQKVGSVAYKLQLPDEARIHPIFHVSCLKKKVGTSVQVYHELPTLHEEEDAILAQLQVVLDRKTRKKQ